MSVRSSAMPSASVDPGGRRFSAADALLHPAVLTAIGLLLLNDHLLKALAPGWVTGKLSDFAGLAFFPILVLAGLEYGLAAAGRRWRPSTRAMAVAVALTGCAFVASKTIPTAAATLGWVLGTAQWLLWLPARWALGGPVQVSQAIVTVDPSDLVALVALAIPTSIGVSQARSASRRDTAPSERGAR